MPEYSIEKAKITEAHNLCMQRRRLLEQTEQCKKDIFVLSQESLEDLISKHKEEHPHNWLTLLWSFGTIGITIFLFVFLYTDTKNAVNSVWWPPLKSFHVMDFFKSTYLVWLFLAFSVLAAILLTALRSHRLKKLYTEALLRNQDLIRDKQSDLGNLSNQIVKLEAYMINQDHCIIPKRYWNCSDMLMGYIYNRRANTITEAVNICESELQNKALHTSSFLVCPRCGRNRIYTHLVAQSNTSIGMIIGAIFLFAVPLVGWIIAIILLCNCSTSRTYTAATCQDCGCTWYPR